MSSYIIEISLTRLNCWK